MSEDWRNELVTKGAVVDALKDNTFRLTLAEEQRCEGHVVWDEDVVFADVLEKALLALPPAQPKKVCIAEIKVDGDELQKCVDKAMNKVVQQQEQPPRMRARWECKGNPNSGKNVEWVCSNCGFSVWAEFCNYKYCNNCGYYMRGKEADE